MSNLPFTKMHGLGNDFMVIDATSRPFDLTSTQIQALADRHRGVGFDQLLVLSSPSSSQVDFDYLIFNSDGSQAEQCGNGARCIARFIQAKNLSQKQQLNLMTAGKITQLSLETDGDVTVEMSEPVFTPSQIPFLSTQNTPPYEVVLENQIVQFHVVNVGNPHAVVLVEQIVESVVNQLGSQLSVHPCFPQQANVGFMQIINPHRINLRVYERGAGLTQACGSGACAAMAIGRRLKLLADEVQVVQLGGNLQIQWNGPGAPIFMRGPAEFVYQGELSYH